jgi:hypothetical protein
MRGFHFDLKTLLSLMTAACIVAWAVSKFTFLGTVFSVILVSVILACLGATKGDSPSIYGCIGGATAIILFIVVCFILHFVGYFYSGKPADYFEDGIATELIIFPPVYIAVYAPLGASVGIVCGFLAGYFLRLFRDDLPSERAGIGVWIGFVVIFLVLAIITINPP